MSHADAPERLRIWEVDCVLLGRLEPRRPPSERDAPERLRIWEVDCVLLGRLEPRRPPSERDAAAPESDAR